MVENVSVSDLKNNSFLNIIDIRSVEKYNTSHILNAKNVPAQYLIINTSKYLNKNEKYYIYCQKGIQSKKVCQVLRNSGYDVVNVIGGYEAWLLSN